MIGWIYKLQCDDGYYYIGSTSAVLLEQRLARHKRDSKISKSKVYNHINNIGWDKTKIIELEYKLFNNVKELKQLEDKYIRDNIDNKLCLNKNRVYITKEEQSEYKKQWKNNKKAS